MTELVKKDRSIKNPVTQLLHVASMSPFEANLKATGLERRGTSKTRGFYKLMFNKVVSKQNNGTNSTKYV